MTTEKTERTAIESLLNEAAIAWNNGDAVVFSQRFAEDGTFTNIRGMFCIGYPTFLKLHEEILTGIFRSTQIEYRITSLQFLSPDVAIVETYLEVSGCRNENFYGVYIDDHGVLRTRLLQVLNKRAGKWMIVAYHNIDIKKDVPVPESSLPR